MVNPASGVACTKVPPLLCCCGHVHSLEDVMRSHATAGAVLAAAITTRRGVTSCTLLLACAASCTGRGATLYAIDCVALLHSLHVTHACIR